MPIALSTREGKKGKKKKKKNGGGKGTSGSCRAITGENWSSRPKPGETPTNENLIRKRQKKETPRTKRATIRKTHQPERLLNRQNTMEAKRKKIIERKSQGQLDTKDTAKNALFNSRRKIQGSLQLNIMEKHSALPGGQRVLQRPNGRGT